MIRRRRSLPLPRSRCGLWPWPLRRESCSCESAMKRSARSLKHEWIHEPSRAEMGNHDLDTTGANSDTSEARVITSISRRTCSLIRPSSNSPFSHSLCLASYCPGLPTLSSGVALPLPARRFSHSSTSCPTSRLSRSVRCSRRRAWYERITPEVMMDAPSAVSARDWRNDRVLLDELDMVRWQL